MSRLHEIQGCKTAEPVADVLFTHGLGGDAFSTWRHGKEDDGLWPAWVAQKHPLVKVWSLGYAAAPRKASRLFGWFSRAWRDRGQSMALPDRALQVLDLMVQRGFGKRPILLVSHSLGGLLTKQMLRTSQEASDAQQRAIFEHTRAVLFLATPHAGADLATLADKFRVVFKGTVSIENLRAHDAHLRNLFNWYRRHSVAANIRTASYFESRNLLGVTIVDPTSAHPGVGSDPVALDEDHLSIAKPRERDCQVCGALDQMILDLVSAGTLIRPSRSSGADDLRPAPVVDGRESAAIHVHIHLDADLRDLVARGLLHYDAREGRFDLHPIVRRYSYDRLAAPDREAAHTRLRDYFAAVPVPEEVNRLEDLVSVIELYHHTVRAGRLDEACDLYYHRLTRPLYFQLGAYLLIIELLRPLLPDGEDRPPRLKDEGDQAWTMNALANCYSFSGQPRHAVQLFEQVNNIAGKRGNKSNLAIGLANVADDQTKIGALRAAETNLRRSIALGSEINNVLGCACGHQYLGRLLAYRGADAESETELATALAMFERETYIQGPCVVSAYTAMRELLRLRQAASGGDSKSGILNLPSAVTLARRALELADENARIHRPSERDYVRAHWVLGAAYRVADQPKEAEHHLHKALERCRRINMVDTEADILIDLARLCAVTGAPDEAQRLAEEALLITERSGYVLQGADAHLELAKLDLARGKKATAREHAQMAKSFATCDGPPDYTYRAAYVEATALLNQLA